MKFLKKHKMFSFAVISFIVLIFMVLPYCSGFHDAKYFCSKSFAAAGFPK